MLPEFSGGYYVKSFRQLYEPEACFRVVLRACQLPELPEK